MDTVVQEDVFRIALLDFYLKTIRESIHAPEYRALFGRNMSRLAAAAHEGGGAGAFFVSSILALFNLTKGGIHMSVDTLESSLLASEWGKAKEMRPGAVIVWAANQPFCSRIGQSRRIGFCIGNNQAVSLDERELVPRAHHWKFIGQEDPLGRSVEALYFPHQFTDTAYIPLDSAETPWYLAAFPRS